MWRSEALLAEVEAVSPADLLAFLPRLLARLHVDVLYHVRLLELVCVLDVVVPMPRTHTRAHK